MGNEQAVSQGLVIQAELMDRAGNKVWAAETPDPNLKLQQGQDYDLNITVSNGSTQNLKNLALSTLVPSGVEIGTADAETTAAPTEKKEGEAEAPATETTAKNGLTYQDVRDDRVLSYFDLAAGSSQQVKIRMNAAYLGKYYFPGLMAEAMYQPATRAQTAGLPVSIVKAAPAPVVPASTASATESSASTSTEQAGEAVVAEEAETDTNPDAAEEEEATN
jgi:hypothetical protein